MSNIRIMSVYLPSNKRLIFALSANIKGVGMSRAIELATKLDLDPQMTIGSLKESDISRIEKFISENYITGPDLDRLVQGNVKLKKQIKSYEGMRHVRGLPVRGQRTKTNARTRKGKRKTVANKKK